MGRQLDRRKILLEESLGFVDAERQVFETRLGELAVHAQTAERERRRGARGDHDVQIGGAVRDELTHQLVRPRVVDVMVVVDEQIDILRNPLRERDDRRRDGLDRPRFVRVGVGALEGRHVLRRDAQARERAAQVMTEHGPVPIVRREREPCDFRAVLHQFLPPLHEQDRLAEARAAGDDGERAMLRFAQPLDEPLARDMAGPTRGGENFAG
ncbi:MULTISPECIES: hypothetical protein [unclassified Caballeronia]|uniref:hypothetical protein n=1 Tax=unclassified Caballeronia TaxID=2646786 RepID=UPI0020290982|nr:MULTISPECIES: hypothetical protein [unclassified Caballeronia]